MHSQAVANPTLEEIAARCREVQKSWDCKTELSRRGLKRSDIAVEVKRYKLRPVS